MLSVMLCALLSYAATEPEPSTARTRLAIMNIAHSGVEEEFAIGLTETIATTISETEVFETVSPKQISALLAYEKRKDVLGACEDERCFTQVAEIVRADHIIGGVLSKVGDELVLNLVMLEAKTGSSLKRVSKESKVPAELLKEVRAAAITLVQPLLSERQGFIKISSNTPGTDVFIDDQRRIEGAGQVIAVAAGPHTVRVAKDGFYTATADLRVRPGRITEESVRLIPAKETMESYESKATLMRVGAFAAAGLAIGAGVLTGVFYSNASGDKDIVDAYANSLEVSRTPETRTQALEASDSFTTNQALYLTFLGTAAATGVTSLVLFLVGDDPGRYDEFDSLNE